MGEIPMHMMLDSFLEAKLITPERGKEIEGSEELRKKLIDRFADMQKTSYRGSRQTLIEFLSMTGKSVYDFRKIALGLLLASTKAINDIVDASYIFKNEKGGARLVRQIDEIRKNLKRYDDFSQREWYLRDMLGFPKRKPKQAVRAVK